MFGSQVILSVRLDLSLDSPYLSDAVDLDWDATLH